MQDDGRDMYSVWWCVWSWCLGALLQSQEMPSMVAFCSSRGFAARDCVYHQRVEARALYVRLFLYHFWRAAGMRTTVKAVELRVGMFPQGPVVTKLLVCLAAV